MASPRLSNMDSKVAMERLLLNRAVMVLLLLASKVVMVLLLHSNTVSNREDTQVSSSKAAIAHHRLQVSKVAIQVSSNMEVSCQEI